MKNRSANPVGAKVLGNGITIYREQQSPGLWRVWAQLHLDLPLAEYSDVNQSVVTFLEKKLEEKYIHLSAEQLLTLFEE